MSCFYWRNMGAEAQGVIADRYTVIPRVLVFPFSQDGKVLLLKGAPEKRIWANLWNGIGGHVEPGEGVLDAAKRELAEESGLTAASWNYCGQIMVNTRGQIGIGFFVFRAEELSGELVEGVEGSLKWFALEELPGYPLVEDVPVLIDKAARAKAGGKPFWGMYQYDERDQLVMSFSS